jgi:hypothetical protein
MGWTCRRVREVRNSYKILVEKPEGKRRRGRMVLKWLLKEQGVRCGLDSTGALVNTVMKLKFLFKVEN